MSRRERLRVHFEGYRRRIWSSVMVLGLSISVAGCASPPSADVDAARVALKKAASERAGQYASTSLKAAQDAQAALDAEPAAGPGRA